ncbi:unnamed protein product [Alopecurus aequalis]
MFSCILRLRRTHNKDKAPVKRCVDLDPPQFTLRLLTDATANFAATNRLGVRDGQQESRGPGPGDFGPVFKGKLKDGQELAVRRLPASYRRLFRFHELEDELLLAAKLKHDNIVQLLGVCLEPPEKLLVYEYLPNGSLDTILYDTERLRHLDWEKRYSIIRGIARGLMYLHGESCLGIKPMRILRPSQILLDDDMNPKILDAGIPLPNTGGMCVFYPNNMVRYAAPEWRSNITSTKSVMFSFGVILLEMVTGRGMYYDWCSAKKVHTGLRHVWDTWKAGSIANIADVSLGHRYPPNEMCKCVHIGLLCLHEDQRLRPDAPTVMQALDKSCPMLLPPPSGELLARNRHFCG